MAKPNITSDARNEIVRRHLSVLERQFSDDIDRKLPELLYTTDALTKMTTTTARLKLAWGVNEANLTKIMGKVHPGDRIINLHQHLRRDNIKAQNILDLFITYPRLILTSTKTLLSKIKLVTKLLIDKDLRAPPDQEPMNFREAFILCATNASYAKLFDRSDVHIYETALMTKILGDSVVLTLRENKGGMLIELTPACRKQKIEEALTTITRREWNKVSHLAHKANIETPAHLSGVHPHRNDNGLMRMGECDMADCD